MKPWEEKYDAPKEGKAPWEESYDAPKEEKPQEIGLGWQALDYLGRGLDYVGGISRTTLGNVADTFTDDNKIGVDDFLNALKGKAPSSDDILERFDVPEGGHINVPFLGKVDARDAGGFALDIASDPLTYVSLGLAPLAKKGLGIGVKKGVSAGAKKALNQTGKLTSKFGKGMYKSGFKKIDEKLLDMGKRELSDIMLEKGVTGNTKTIQKAASQMSDDLLLKRDEIYKAIEKTGQKVDMDSAFSKVIDSNEALRKVPGQSKVADSFDDKILEYMADPKVSVKNASTAKSLLYDTLPNSAFSQTGRMNSMGKKFNRDMGKALKEAIEDTAEKSVGKGKELTALNDELGTLLSAKKPIQNQVARANSINGLSSVDAATLVINPMIAAAKKGGDISKGTWFRTKVGKALNDLGESGVQDILLRQMFMDRENYSDNKNPWESVK